MVLWLLCVLTSRSVSFNFYKCLCSFCTVHTCRSRHFRNAKVTALFSVGPLGYRVSNRVQVLDERRLELLHKSVIGELFRYFPWTIVCPQNSNLCTHFYFFLFLRCEHFMTGRRIRQKGTCGYQSFRAISVRRRRLGIRRLLRAEKKDTIINAFDACSFFVFIFHILMVSAFLRQRQDRDAGELYK